MKRNQRYIPFSVRSNHETYVKSIEDLLTVLFPHEIGSQKHEACCRVFKAIKNSKTMNRKAFKELADDEINFPLLSRAARKLEEVGILTWCEDGYKFTNELSDRLRNFADLIDAFMSDGLRDPKHKDLKTKLKISRQAFESIK